MVEHPIHPPTELVQELWDRLRKAPDSGADAATAWTEAVALAAQWGADQELEACCDWVSQWRCQVGGNRPEVGLRAARRPKPPTLKEQALAQLDLMTQRAYARNFAGFQADAIRRALEALPDDINEQS